jgi:CDP-paratose 2-epimerase
MQILITGICGFVGATLARTWKERGTTHALAGVDSLMRPGSETNRATLRSLGIDVIHGDIRLQSDVDALPPADWVIDAAANPSVLAGTDSSTSSRRLLEHNLLGTVNVLEYCKARKAGLILLSTSRVYALADLARIQVHVSDGAFRPAPEQAICGLSPHGLSEAFSTAPPLSLYGVAKLSSEQLALEYANAFNFPVWVNRCGVLAGAQQFGKADQGIFSYWIHSWARRRPLTYIGFDGMGHQVRDCLHPRDLISLLDAQMANPSAGGSRILNVSGGAESACSLRQLSGWCTNRFGPHTVTSSATQRPYDVPWLVLDSSTARTDWNWAPATPREAVFREIADHAEAHPTWLDVSSQ